MEKAYIVSAARTPVGKAYRGSLIAERPDDLAGLAMKEAVARAGIQASELEDVILGCAMPEGEQGMNVARIAQMVAGIPVEVPAITVNRFCSSGLQAIAYAADKIRLGDSDLIIAGGTESMTMIPMGGNKVAPNPKLVDSYPEIYTSMGITAEKVAEKYNISREDQDLFAVESNNRALAAQKAGRFDDEIVPVEVVKKRFGKGIKTETSSFVLKQDEGPRASTLEGLARLKPAFKLGGSVTAGNSSQMSDGAAALVLASGSKCEKEGLKPLARFVDFVVAGCEPEIMGIGPAVAVPKLLKKTGLKLEDIDLFEVNEAFAAQALMVVRELGLDTAKVNVNGGAIALGHPLGCTGAKLSTTLLYEMQRRNSKYGIVTMCIGGGMGAAGLFERE
ncbi:MAG: acetyl-CoA C-acyltransferase [Acidobacteria bacterium]|nr:MAG: acetyl-CoA C-acyltransferase [Acidobacteriota bacterium]PIE90792.1 MAG: acetyl-CoA C-acyltransferase [Acidobacteriota bacterium]